MIGCVPFHLGRPEGGYVERREGMWRRELRTGKPRGHWLVMELRRESLAFSTLLSEAP